MTVVEKNTLDDGGSKLRHAVGEPCRHTAAVQRQVRHSRTLHTSIVYVPRAPKAGLPNLALLVDIASAAAIPAQTTNDPNRVQRRVEVG